MYSILRTAKIKDRQQINSMAEHNFRLRDQLNIKNNLSHLNQILINNLNVDTTKKSSLQEKLTEHYDSLNIKEKKDNVLMMEFVVTASPEFFENISEEKLKKWVDHQVDFFKQEFGDQVKMAVLHRDETTPHIHFMLGTEQHSVKKYKNQKGEFFKESWSLSAKKFNPEYLTDLQSAYALHNSPFGLLRGKPQPGRKHTKLKDYYDEITQKMAVIDKAANEAEKLNKLKEYYPKLKESIVNQMTVIEELLGILETKELSENEQVIIDKIGSKIIKKTPKPKV